MLDAAAAAWASKTTYLGAGGGILAWAASIDWLAVISFLIAVAGFVTNWYYQAKRNNRERVAFEKEEARKDEKHKVEMKNLKGECNAKQD